MVDHGMERDRTIEVGEYIYGLYGVAVFASQGMCMEGLGIVGKLTVWEDHLG